MFMILAKYLIYLLLNLMTDSRQHTHMEVSPYQIADGIILLLEDKNDAAHCYG